MVNIEELENKYFTFNLSVPYKLKCGTIINIYPILLKDYYDFKNGYSFLIVEKNKIPSAEIIRMSYLEFVFNVLLDSEPKQKIFKQMLRLCFHEEDIYLQFDEKGKPVILILEKDVIKHIITEKDFNDIKRIVLFQNIDGYDEVELDADMENVIQEMLELEQKGMHKVTLEDKLIYLGNETGLSVNQMLNMTYREFCKRFSMVIANTDYKIKKTAELSGNVKFSKPIEHPIYHKEVNKYERFFTDKDSFVNKINK